MAPFLMHLMRLAAVITPISFRSFTEAYKQAARNAPRMDFGGKLGIKPDRKPPMTFEEAARILGIEKDSSSKDQIDFEQVQKTFERLFTVNDPKRGGSFYLQSRVWNARKKIEEELAQEGILKPEDIQKYKQATEELLRNMSSASTKSKQAGS